MLRRGQSDTGSGYQYSGTRRLLCSNKRADATPFVAARQLSQFQLSLTGVCFEVSDKRGRVENIRMSSLRSSDADGFVFSSKHCTIQSKWSVHNSDDSNWNETGGRTQGWQNSWWHCSDCKTKYFIFHEYVYKLAHCFYKVSKKREGTPHTH